jgi:hypothetical protein
VTHANGQPSLLLEPRMAIDENDREVRPTRNFVWTHIKGIAKCKYQSASSFGTVQKRVIGGTGKITRLAGSRLAIAIGEGLSFDSG